MTDTDHSNGVQQARAAALRLAIEAASAAARQLEVVASALDDAQTGPVGELVPALHVASEATRRAWDAVAVIVELGR